MKRLLSMALAVVMSVFFVGAALAAEKATMGTTDTGKSAPEAAKSAPEAAKSSPEAAKSAPAGAKSTTDMSAMKGKTRTLTGEVTNVDMSAKTIAVKGKKGEETFDVSNVKNADSLKAGEKVTVRYAEQDGKMVAKSVKMTGAKKTAKKEKKEKTG